MALWPQPEDLMAQALLDVLEGRRPRNTEHHRYYSAPPPPGGGDPNRRGVSHNHFQLAVAVGLGSGDTAALPAILRSRTPQHDFQINEPYPKDSYFAFTLLAKLTQVRFLRGGARSVRDEDLAASLLDDARQDLAALLVASTDPGGVLSAGRRRTANWIVQAGPRAAPTKRGGKLVRRFREYILLRAAGWSDADIRSRAADGARLVNRCWRPPDHWGEASIGDFVDILERELRSAFDVVATSYELAGWPGVLNHFRRGTRVPFEWRRSGGGVVSVMELNCNGNKGPIAAALWETNWNAPETFPPWAPVKGFEDTRAEIHADKVTAWSESCGAWSESLPGGAVELHWRSDSTGVHSLLPEFEPKPETPPKPGPRPQPRPANPEPDSEISWWRRALARLKVWWAKR